MTRGRRYKLFKELERITANEKANQSAVTTRAPDRTERAYQRKGGAGDAKAAAIKAKLAERKQARAVTTNRAAGGSSAAKSEEEAAQTEAIARALLQA